MITSIIQNKIIRKIFIFAFWIFIWQAIYLFVGEEILFVSPLQTINKFAELFFNTFFWKTILISMTRIVLGYISAVIFGVLTACFAVKSKIFFELIYPLLNIIKTTPVASFIILALLWLKTGSIPSFISFLIVSPIVFSNVYEGIKNTDESLLQMADIYNFSNIKKLKYIYIPSVLPHFVSACLVSVGLSWKSGIAAEVICTPKNSIGSMLYNSKIYLETDELFAWTFTVVVLSIIFEKLMVFVFNSVKKVYNI